MLRLFGVLVVLFVECFAASAGLSGSGYEQVTARVVDRVGHHWYHVFPAPGDLCDFDRDLWRKVYMAAEAGQVPALVGLGSVALGDIAEGQAAYPVTVTLSAGGRPFWHDVFHYRRVEIGDVKVY